MLTSIHRTRRWLSYVAAVIAVFTCAAARGEFYVLPFNGGVGVGRTLQMQILEYHRGSHPAPLGPRQQSAVQWSSSNMARATVDASGLVRGVSAGSVTITAKVGAARVQSTVTVAAPVAALQPAPPATLNLTQYCRHSLEVIPEDAAGTQLLNRPVTWSNSAPTIVRLTHPLPSQSVVSQTITPAVKNLVDRFFMRRQANLLALAPGQAVIRPRSEGIGGSINVQVAAAAVTTISVAPQSLELDVGDTSRIVAVAYNNQGCNMPATFTWSSSDASVATVSGDGTVTGIKSGTAQITAAAPSGVTATVSVVVPAVALVQINPSAGELDIGDSRTLAATTRSSNGSILHNRSVIWSTSNSNVTVQPSTGYSTTATGQSIGSTTITATSEAISATTTGVVPPVSTVTISPSSADISLGGTRSFTATARSASGMSLSRPTTWSESSSRISLSPSSGRTTTVTGQSSGDATITATSEGRSGSASVHVKTFCQSNTCFSAYRVDNYSTTTYDVYHLHCSASSCTGWQLQGPVPPNMYRLVSGLTENDAYAVRVLTSGCEPTLWNCVRNESTFYGGPGGNTFIITVIQ